jgi:hypothetical protein
MKKLFIELLNYRCITYALRILGGGRTPRTPPLNPPLHPLLMIKIMFAFEILSGIQF